MHSFIKITLLALCLSVANSREIPALSRTVSGNDLIEVLLRNNKLSRAVNSDACFDYYNPILNQISEEYRVSYAACVSEANSAKADVDESTRAEREDLENQANAAHESLISCSESPDTISFLECYESKSLDNTKVMYSISNKAADILARTRESYRVIEYSEERCTNASDRAYVENTSQTYDELVSCLMGLSTVPPSQPDTTTAAPEETTAAPEETTAAPEETTAAPEETTAAPEETTAAPEETTAAPEETTVAPEETTAAPEETTAAPEETTAAPEETTAAPEETTAAPEETTAAPEETTSAPEETTAAPEETTAEPEVTTEGSGGESETEEETEEKTEEETEEKTEEDTEEENSESVEDSRFPEEDLFQLSGDKIRNVLENVKDRLKAHYKQY